MLWIGITGPMGSGKSTVAHRLRQMGFEVVDADAVARKVLGPGTDGEVEVLRTFGEQLRDRQGRLDRRALGRLVFGDPLKLARLEAIIHPLVRTEVAEQRLRFDKRGDAAAFYDVPLLFEKNMQAQFDLILVVNASKAARIERIKTRSQLTDEEIDERSRHHVAESIKEAAASAVIRNDGDVADLEVKLRQVLTQLKVPIPATSRG